MADRTSKRGDNWEPVTGRAMDANGPVDLLQVPRDEPHEDVSVDAVARRDAELLA